MDIVNLVSLIVTCAALIFAVVVHCRSIGKKRLISEQANSVHNNIALMLGAAQAAKRDFSEGKDPQIEIGRAEGLAQALLHDSAKLYCTITNLNQRKLNELCGKGKLNINYKDVYSRYVR